MKKIVQLICLLSVTGMLLTVSCKKAEEPEPSKEKETSQAIPTEPAPVPEGTPKY